MDWFQPLSEPVLTTPVINFGVEIQPAAFVPPATVVTDSVMFLIDLVNENLR